MGTATNIPIAETAPQFGSKTPIVIPGTALAKVLMLTEVKRVENRNSFQVKIRTNNETATIPGAARGKI